MKWIIFDIDGTLTDTSPVDDKCFFQAFKATFGADISHQSWEEVTHVTDWGITEELVMHIHGRKPTAKEYESMIATFVELLEKEKSADISQFQEIMGASNFFQYAKNRSDWKLGIATGGWENSALLKLDVAGIDVGGVAFSNSTHYKSREDIIRHVFRQLSANQEVTKEHIFYFGDGIWDYQTCQNLGIRFIGIDYQENNKLTGLGAKTVFRDFMQKEAIICALDSQIC